MKTLKERIYCQLTYTSDAMRKNACDAGGWPDEYAIHNMRMYYTLGALDVLESLMVRAEEVASDQDLTEEVKETVSSLRNFQSPEHARHLMNETHARHCELVRELERQIRAQVEKELTAMPADYSHLH